MTNPISVIVVGGGYAGVVAANRLQHQPGVRVTLVNPRSQFVERIRLHQLVAGTGDATVDFEGLLGERVELVVDGVTRIDAPARRVDLASGAALSYDYLVYAVGSTGAVPAGVPGAAQFAHALAELEQAKQLRARLHDVPLSAPIVLVGGGLTGVEAAAELAEAGRSVTLVGDALAPSVAESGRRSLRKALGKLGVTIIDGPAAMVARVTAEFVELSDGRSLPSTVTVWTAGFGMPGLAAASGLTTDAAGRLLTDETLTSVDDPHIVAAGDAAAPSGLPLRMSCQAAMPLGVQAAQTVMARIAGTQPDEIDQAFTGQCISVGRRAGTVQLAHPDDSPRRAYLGGRVAALVKEQVCRLTVASMRREARKPGAVFYFKSDWRRERLAARAQQDQPDQRAVPVR